MESLANDDQKIFEISENLQELMLSKIHSLLVIVMQKFTESDQNQKSETEIDMKSDFSKKKNIFTCLDECICKIGNIKLDENLEPKAKPSLNGGIGDGFQYEHETCETMKYNLKLARKKVNKLKQKNNELKAKLTDESFKSKGLLRMAKYLTAKYHEHVQEINDKVLKIGNLEEKNHLLEKDLRKILNKLRVIRKRDTSKMETHGQLKQCMKKQGIILEKMYLTERNIAMVNSLILNENDENSNNSNNNNNDYEMRATLSLLNNHILN